jgi:CRP-like cAMP-binding protein
LTADDIRKAEARYQRASRRAEEALKARDALIEQAIADRWSHARIAEASGLTRGRVGQLAQRFNADGANR